MIPVEIFATGSSPQARIDVYRIVLGETGAGKKFEVTGVYIHALPSMLPSKVIRAILKDECDIEEIRPLLARGFGLATNQLNLLFLKQAGEASLRPLRSEVFGVPGQSVTWHFFAATDEAGLAAVIRTLKANVV